MVVRHARGASDDLPPRHTRARRTVHEALEQVAKSEGFGVLHVHDLRQILTGKGVPQSDESRVLEICNPAQADAVLDMDMALNMIPPCRVSVWGQDGWTRVGMLPPTQSLGLLSQDMRVANAASEVETAIDAADDRRGGVGPLVRGKPAPAEPAPRPLMFPPVPQPLACHY